MQPVSRVPPHAAGSAYRPMPGSVDLAFLTAPSGLEERAPASNLIAAAINDRLQRELDYVEEERRILQEQLAATGGKKLSFTADQRRRLATAGKQLTPDERQKCCLLVKPATILAWFRQLAARKYDSSDARRGRPPKRKDVRKLVVELALANPGWGYTKIRDALRTGPLERRR